MQDEEPRRLPTTVGGLFGLAAGLYVRRAALYVALASVVLIVQFVADVLLPHTLGTAQAIGIVADAFVIGAVAIGVARDLAGEPPAWRAVLGATSERWGVVAVAGFVYFLVQEALLPGVFGTPDQTGYLFFVAPIITFWGAVALSQVAAAIEPASSRLQLPLIALGKALSVSLRAVNLIRLVFFSAILVLPTLAEAMLGAAFTERHLVQAAFWANVPLDALTVGPLQGALATVFYVDFARRARRARR